MRLLLLLAIAALLTGCASQECYTEEDIDAAYTWGYQVGRASLLRCPECPPCPDPPDTTNFTRAVREAVREAREILADEIEKLEADTDTEWGHIKALYR